jgi:hypothetical protein
MGIPALQAAWCDETSQSHPSLEKANILARPIVRPVGLIASMKTPPFLLGPLVLLIH